MASIFCTTNTPDYVQLDCGVERSGIVAIALVDRTIGEPSDANLASNTYWNTLLNQSPSIAFIIKSTRGEYPRPTVTSEEGFGREDKQNTGAEHIVNLEVEGILNNRAFWESVNRKKWKVGFVTAQDLMYFVNKPVSVDARINNPKDIKGQAFWMVEFSWADFDNPRVIDVAAATIFQD